MAAAAGLQVVRKGVYEPEGYRPPTRPVDDKRPGELIEHILSTNPEDQADEQSDEAGKPVATQETSPLTWNW